MLLAWSRPKICIQFRRPPLRDWSLRTASNAVPLRVEAVSFCSEHMDINGYFQEYVSLPFRRVGFHVAVAAVRYRERAIGVRRHLNPVSRRVVRVAGKAGRIYGADRCRAGRRRVTSRIATRFHPKASVLRAGKRRRVELGIRVARTPAAGISCDRRSAHCSSIR